jgi:hypothetical protein
VCGPVSGDEDNSKLSGKGRKGRETSTVSCHRPPACVSGRVGMTWTLSSGHCQTCQTLYLQEHTPCRAKHIQSTFALFHNQLGVLFSFIYKVDQSSTHLASVCCAIERSWQHGGVGRK